MAAVALDRHHWSSLPQIPMSMPIPDLPLPQRNDVELTHDKLIVVLDYLSDLLARPFNNCPLRLVVHGGACMLLHPGLYSLSQQQHLLSHSLPRRTSTRDVDYIKRSFVAEWNQFGVTDAADRLQTCINATARHFRLGADWMNSDADVALPMAKDPSGNTYDPIYAASVQPNNTALHTIYTSKSGLLTLISVTPFWAVSLKLVRYTKWDPGDICLLLRNGTILSGTQWTPEMLENWLYAHCWAMGYSSYDSKRKSDMRSKILHAIQMVSSWEAMTGHAPHSKVSADAAMGAGQVVGGEHGEPGWKSTIGARSSQESLTRLKMPSFLIPHQPHRLREKPSHDRKSRRPSPQRVDTTAPRDDIFVPPDLEEEEHHEWLNPNHAPVSVLSRSLRRRRSRDSTPSPPSPVHWMVVPDPSHKPRRHKHPPSVWQDTTTLHSMPSVEEFDRSLDSMLRQSQGVALASSQPFATNPAVIPQTSTSRHKKEKSKEKKKARDKARNWDRQLKWMPRSPPGGVDSTDSESGSSSGDEVASRRYAQQLGVPRAPSWNIYASNNLVGVSDARRERALSTGCAPLYSYQQTMQGQAPPIHRLQHIDTHRHRHRQHHQQQQQQQQHQQQQQQQPKLHSHPQPTNTLGLYY